VHFGIAKTCNFSTKCPNDDNDGGIYYTRTEGGFWKVLLAFSEIQRVFGANTYGIISREGISESNDGEFIYVQILMYSFEACFEEKRYTS